MQRVLYWARMGVKLGASATPHREETRALFLVWEDFGSMLHYVAWDG